MFSYKLYLKHDRIFFLSLIKTANLICWSLFRYAFFVLFDIYHIMFLLYFFWHTSKQGPILENKQTNSASKKKKKKKKKPNIKTRNHTHTQNATKDCWIIVFTIVFIARKGRFWVQFFIIYILAFIQCKLWFAEYVSITDDSWS